ncbi:peptidoglycan-binding domain-containing protein [Aestuariicoccus sp. MJ-SS9]|uniref:peptidoglycan-binding domain-containing protein n=1 Tax=Aestuariicoccus sp. MJ-SS9 TaxID=3079855 RepID=UPI00290DB49D|nr:peptidoglycan-binding domain-containing protein [Aestuariicoccus sp. MJ-SS9]MDU8911358.1 peptidoglycan-binding domain-containing protein [Aestuariicoccus sp. MJ-SS9]
MFKRICAALLIGATPVLADSDALVIANGAYDRLDPVEGAANVSAAAGDLAGAGYDTIALADVSAGKMRDGLKRLIGAMDGDTDTLAVVLTGHFAHTGADSYLLPVNAPARVDDTTVLNNALPLSTLWPLLEAYPGQAVLILGEGSVPDMTARFAQGGLGPLEAPQGVTVVQGAAEDVSAMLSRAAKRPGLSVRRLAERYDLVVSGFVTDRVVLVPAAPDAPVDSGADADEALWQRVVARDDLQAYRDYLAAFPVGSHAGDARQRIAAIENDPNRKHRLAEEALDLSRDARRAIQRDLSLLGYDTRGIDGIFGNGTRAAIGKWQATNGHGETTYLNRAQIDQLDRQAQRRAAELEEEARARQEELERQDRAFWRDTGASGAENDLRAYLRRYPDGLFSDEATARLDEIEDSRRDRAADRDRRAWDDAREAGTERAFREYLEAFPEGAFASEARARLARLGADTAARDLAERASRQEQALGLNAGARRLVEVRLGQLGLNPGKVDGTFDKKTRRALRRYQESRGLTVTGYLDQATVVRLLADSL